MTISRTKPIQIRPAREDDLPDLLTLEQRAVETDRLSRRSFRRFLAGSGSALMVAGQNCVFAGYALVLFRPRCTIARLYSLAVCPNAAGRGVGVALIEAIEAVARKHRCKVVRHDVHERNSEAILRCKRAGFREISRNDGYYDDRCAAVRFEKSLYALPGSE